MGSILRPTLLILATAILTATASAHGQSAVTPTPFEDASRVCDAYGEAEVIFVGLAEEPITFRISGEAVIEEARQNLIRTEAEIARLRASLDPKTRLERELEFTVALLKAEDEIERRRVMFPPPYDLTVFPMLVERAFRGVTEPRLMVHLPIPSMTMEPGKRYLISGNRSTNYLLPFLVPFPELERLLPFKEYVELRPIEVDIARQGLQFLTSVAGGATIVGDLRRHSYGDLRGAALAGVRVLVSSEGMNSETVTRDDGSFIASGLQAGRVTVRPLLPADLTVVNKSALTFTLREGGCKTLWLTADLNGRVRGRIVSATGTSLDGVELLLTQERVLANGDVSMSPHDPQLRIRPNEDGRFEFSGVPPGSYLLVAGLRKTERGESRSFTTYFPGTTDRTAAVRIDVGRATLHEGVDFLVVTD